MSSSLDLLEFPALVAILDRYAHTPSGHRAIGESSPGRERAWLERIYRLAGEAARYLRDAEAGRRGVLRLDFGGIDDPVVVGIQRGDHEWSGRLGTLGGASLAAGGRRFV